MDTGSDRSHVLIEQQNGNEEGLEPLLDACSDDSGDYEAPECDNFWPCVFNLTKGTIGAGMMALPRAVAMLGSWFGFGLLWLVAAMTWASISGGMVHPVAKLLRRTFKPSEMFDYSNLVRSYLGSGAVVLLNIVLMGDILGCLVIFMDITADVLLGTPEIPGIIPDILSSSAAPAWLSELLVSRAFFLGLYTVVVLGPICLRRNIASLGALNVTGLAALGALGLSLVWLSAAAVRQGKAHVMPSWPESLPTQAGGGGMAGTLALLSTLPVILTASGCQLNIMPLAGMMKPFNTRSMDKVVAVAVALATAFYMLVAAASYTAFGADIQEDILKNLSPSSMEALLGSTQAHLVSYTVRIAYVVSLLGATGLNTFPLREAIWDVMYGKSGYKDVAREKEFNSLTIVILFFVYVVAVAVPSIWKVIGFVGSIMATGVSFIFPASVLLVYAKTSFTGASKNTFMAYAFLQLFIGLAIMANGLTDLALVLSSWTH